MPGTLPTFDPNLPSYSDAMTGPHREHFIVACKKEIDAMEDRGTWYAVLRKDVPKDVKQQLNPLNQQTQGSTTD